MQPHLKKVLAEYQREKRILGGTASTGTFHKLVEAYLDSIEEHLHTIEVIQKIAAKAAKRGRANGAAAS